MSKNEDQEKLMGKPKENKQQNDPENAKKNEKQSEDTDEESKEKEPSINIDWTIYTEGDKSEARSENFCESLKLLCCPRLGILQFITIISIIEGIIFIISLCVLGVSNDSFLAPNDKALRLMGAADAKSTKNDYQFYRLIMPAFLHANLEHIAGNVFFQLIFGSGIEYGIGFLNMAFLYIVSEIGGILLAITFYPEAYGVGASCAGYGLFGFYLSYIFTNFWYMLRKKPWQILFLSVVVLFFFLSNQGLSINPLSQNAGHQGGFISGILIGFTISEQYDYRAIQAGRSPDRYTDEEWKDRSTFRYIVCARCGLILLIVWFVTLICLFYCYTNVNVEQG